MNLSIGEVVFRNGLTLEAVNVSFGNCDVGYNSSLFYGSLSLVRFSFIMFRIILPIFLFTELR